MDEAQTTEAPAIEDLKNEDGKNKDSITCKFCNSLILRPNHGVYSAEHKFDLPLMHQKNSKEISSVETESLNDFWLIGDKFTFENIGFSHTVDNVKFLTCADCEMGPIGFHRIQNEMCFIAIGRVTHGNKKK